MRSCSSKGRKRVMLLYVGNESGVRVGEAGDHFEDET
ncbi:hypothetical protein A2U01_0100558, partial [Trifolium medium]|nr:hypothetical protein [Trifolium medium]